MFEIILSDEAKKNLNKLDNSTRERLILALESLRIRPFSKDLKKLIGTPYFRFRVGDYRIILTINMNKLTILVVKIKRRENVYQ